MVLVMVLWVGSGWWCGLIEPPWHNLPIIATLQLVQNTIEQNIQQIARQRPGTRKNELLLQTLQTIGSPCAVNEFKSQYQ